MTHAGISQKGVPRVKMKYKGGNGAPCSGFCVSSNKNACIPLMMLTNPKRHNEAATMPRQNSTVTIQNL